MRCNVHLALSRFTAELLGRPDEYKYNGGANFYPSDCLYDWGFRHIDKDGKVVENPDLAPMSVAGITCGGCVKMNDTPRVLTIWFKDLI
jgi:hypothetical protein